MAWTTYPRGLTQAETLGVLQVILIAVVLAIVGSVAGAMLSAFATRTLVVTGAGSILLGLCIRPSLRYAHRLRRQRGPDERDHGGAGPPEWPNNGRDLLIAMAVVLVVFGSALIFAAALEGAWLTPKRFTLLVVLLLAMVISTIRGKKARLEGRDSFNWFVDTGVITALGESIVLIVFP